MYMQPTERKIKSCIVLRATKLFESLCTRPLLYFLVYVEGLGTRLLKVSLQLQYLLKSMTTSLLWLQRELDRDSRFQTVSCPLPCSVEQVRHGHRRFHLRGQTSSWTCSLNARNPAIRQSSIHFRIILFPHTSCGSANCRLSVVQKLRFSTENKQLHTVTDLFPLANSTVELPIVDPPRQGQCI